MLRALAPNRMTSRFFRPLMRLPTVTSQLGWTSRWSSGVTTAQTRTKPDVSLVSIVPGNSNNSTKIVFSDNSACDFHNIWLRDNCTCKFCIHPETLQKTLDTPSLDVNIRPKSLTIESTGHLSIEWPSSESDVHHSRYSPEWLHRYGLFFTEDGSKVGTDVEYARRRPELQLWDRVQIWKKLPEISWQEFMDSDDGLRTWLELMHRFGVVFIRGVPTERDQVVKVVNRFAYVKRTSYGHTFDVVNDPDPKAHLAYTGVRLELHTDLDYREKSPGLQFLHCLEASSTQEGKSFFVDGFFAAQWLRQHHPTAFHILSSTPVIFSIMTSKMRYSQQCPTICTGRNGELLEIHYNNRTTRPLQAPSQVIPAYYHAYKTFSDKLRDPSSELRIQMVPGDLVAFNNRRVLHGRTSFNPLHVSRRLQGCYADMDEAMARYDSLLA